MNIQNPLRFFRPDETGASGNSSRRMRPVIGAVACITLVGILTGCAIGAETATSSTSSSSSSEDTTTAATEASSDSNTEEVTAAAKAFLATLDDTQLDAVSYDYSDDDAKSNWSNLPEGSVQRNGLSIGEMTDEQHNALLSLLQAMLSDDGYQQVLEIMEADDVLAESGGGGLGWSSDNYYIAFFGEPSTASAYLIQFGGHHLALNIDYSGDTVTMTPEFVGVEPRTWTRDDGTAVEPLGEMQDAVFSLLGGLTEDQLSQSELSAIYDDVVMGAGNDDEAYPDDGGLLVSELPQEQQDQVTEAIRQWVGDLDEDVAEQIIAAYVSEYDQTSLSWSGSTDADAEGAYFRISGPSVWIEYVNQSGVGFDDVHIHTVYRDKTSDYGTVSE
ncbi:DUF3500 domain-containing protein [Okibacterium endophyticum]